MHSSFSSVVDFFIILGQLRRYHVVTTWMGDCLQTGKRSRYITNIKINSAFHPSGVDKSSTG